MEKAEKAGFVNLEKGNSPEHTALKAGDRVMPITWEKGMALFVIGKESMEKGMNILGAHIDSPSGFKTGSIIREDTDFHMLDTHYYGGNQEIPVSDIAYLGITWCYCKKDGTVVKEMSAINQAIRCLE